MRTHIAPGLPGETAEDMRESAREIARWPIDAVKLHNLYAVRDTPLADQVARQVRKTAPQQPAPFASIIWIPRRSSTRRAAGSAVMPRSCTAGAATLLPFRPPPQA